MTTELEIKHKAKKIAIKRILKPPAVYVLYTIILSFLLIFLLPFGTIFDFLKLIAFLSLIIAPIVYFFWYRHYKKEEITKIKIQLEKEIF